MTWTNKKIQLIWKRWRRRRRRRKKKKWRKKRAEIKLYNLIVLETCLRAWDATSFHSPWLKRKSRKTFDFCCCFSLMSDSSFGIQSINSGLAINIKGEIHFYSPLNTRNALNIGFRIESNRKCIEPVFFGCPIISVLSLYVDICIFSWFILLIS